MVEGRPLTGVGQLLLVVSRGGCSGALDVPQDGHEKGRKKVT